MLETVVDTTLGAVPEAVRIRCQRDVILNGLADVGAFDAASLASVLRHDFQGVKLQLVPHAAPLAVVALLKDAADREAAGGSPSPPPSPPPVQVMPARPASTAKQRAWQRGGASARYAGAWKQSRPESDALQRTVELNLATSAIDNVLLNPKDIQREQLIRVLVMDEEAAADAGKPWGHPIGENPVLRFLKYWLGPFGSTRDEYSFLQPANDLANNIQSGFLAPAMVFDALFALYALELTMAAASTPAVAELLAWKISTVLLAFTAPISAMMPAASCMHARVIASVSRPRLRKFIGKWSHALSQPHGLRITSFLSVMLATSMRSVCTHYMQDGAGAGALGWLVAGAFCASCVVCSLIANTTLRMWYSAWLPWEEARAAAAEKEKREGDAAFYFGAEGAARAGEYGDARCPVQAEVVHEVPQW